MTDHGAMESLYPFLYSDTADLTAVLDRSAPRPWPRCGKSSSCARWSAARDADRIAECAGQAADRFSAGGRLFAFGNGGSATDAPAARHPVP